MWMKAIDSSNSAYLNSAWGMMNQVEVVKLLKEKNNLLYTILKERNPEQLSNLEFQLYQEINSHFAQVLKELETTYPVSQELSWIEKLQKKELQAQDDVVLLPDRIETEKKYRTILAEEYEYFKEEIEANNLRDTEHFTFYDVKGNEYHDLKEAWDAIQECTKGYKLSDYKENKFVGRFMKADVLIGLGLAGEGIVIKMKTPLRTINVDSVNPVGRVNFNRMYKRINDIRYSLNKTIETIQNYEGNLKIAKEMVNKPFELQDELTSARNRQKEINKILDTSGNENSKVVVEYEVEEERNESCMEL